MFRAGTVLTIVLVLIGAPAAGTAAQDVPSCTELTAAEAQAALDRDPTYDTRAQLDPDDDGNACEASEQAAARTDDSGDPDENDPGADDSSSGNTDVDDSADDSPGASGLGAGGRTPANDSGLAGVPQVTAVPATGAGSIDPRSSLALAVVLAAAAAAVAGAAGLAVGAKPRS